MAFDRLRSLGDYLEASRGSSQFAEILNQQCEMVYAFFSSIVHSHVRTSVDTLQTDKHDRFKIDGLKPFFNVFFKNILAHGYTWLHMATHV